MYCELSNIEAIDENVSSAVGLSPSFASKLSTNIGSSSTPKEKIDWGSIISSGVGLVGGIITNQQQNKAAENLQKSQIQSQREADQRAADLQSKSQLFDMQRQKMLLEKSALDSDLASKMQMMQRTDGSETGSSGSGSGKFLGMPKAVGITVAVVGGLALIVGGILIVRKMRKK